MKKLLAITLLLATGSLIAADKKILLIAGSVSHGAGEHEFKAGCLLLKQCLDQVPGLKTEVRFDGWPRDDNAFDGADAVFIYCDGGDGHPAIKPERLKLLGELMSKGVGLGCAHYAVEVPKDRGGAEWLAWIGGYFEAYRSVNPHWKADIKELPSHPITRGVKPFKILDEWYYHMRFPEGMKGTTPILTAVPSDATRGADGANDSHGGNPEVQQHKGEPEHLMWCTERADGGRGFGFTGGHFHRNWGDDNFRKIVLNAILWSAKIEVPENGVESTVLPEDLTKNLDRKGDEKPAVAHPFGREAALSEMKQMHVASGLEATLFACEPMVVNPCDMDVDARGRVWITEGANYRSSFQKWGILRPEGDRIVILEDTDGDGVADRAKTFYQDPSINAALGICVLGNQVIVSSSPNVFVLTDTDGDDVADKREVLFTGISGFDHDHAVHAFVFGPDGKLYFNFGNEGKQLRRPPASLRDNCPLHGVIAKEEIAKSEPVLDVEGKEVAAKGKPFRQGMVFRCNADGSAVEVLAHNFRNNYEVCVDSFGTLWQSDNDDDGNRGVRINYVMEFGNYGYTDEMTGAGWGTAWDKAKKQGASEDERPYYHWHQYDPGVVPNLLQTGNGSPTGICIYEGQLLPPIFRNQMLHCDAGPRVARAYPVTHHGAGYSATETNLLTSDDTWYRPSDLCVGPDGSVYIADWNDAAVGGHNMADQILKSLTGRVYRVAPPGHKPSAPSLDLKTAAGAVQALQSPNQATRYLAWTELNRMQRKAEKELLKLWKSPDPRMRARALQLLARIKGKEKHYAEAALQDSNADLRITALRIARALKLAVIPYVRTLANDGSAQVRRECALALRHNPSPEAPKLWAALAQQHDGRDRWYLEALGLAMDQQENKFFDAWLAAVGDRWNTPAGRDIIWRSRATSAPALLAKIVTDANTPAKERGRYLRALDFITGPEKEAALVEIATASLK